MVNQDIDNLLPMFNTVILCDQLWITGQENTVDDKK